MNGTRTATCLAQQHHHPKGGGITTHLSGQKMSTMALVTLLIWLAMTVDVAQPADTLYLCMKNCEQCKSMYGAYFEGDLCAKSCFRLKGAFIPDCIDVASIGQFLNKNE